MVRIGLSLDAILLTERGVEIALLGSAGPGNEKRSGLHSDRSCEKTPAGETDELAVVGILGRLMVETCCLGILPSSSSQPTSSPHEQLSLQLELVRERYGSELHQLLDRMTGKEATIRPRVYATITQPSDKSDRK